jgi:hypothetical protein
VSILGLYDVCTPTYLTPGIVTFSPFTLGGVGEKNDRRKDNFHEKGKNNNLLAHDHNSLVSGAHLHLLHQVSHLQYPSGGLRDTILWPPQMLELSNCEACGTTWSYGNPRMTVGNIKLSDDIVSMNLLLGESNRVFSVSLTAASSQRPVLMTHFLE